MRRAQVSVDFTLSVFIAMVLFLVVFYSARSQQKETEHVIRGLDARHVSEMFASRINDVYLGGNGAVETVILPETIYGGVKYTLRVYPRSVLVNYSSEVGGRFYSTMVFVKNVNGSESGLDLDPGVIRITNTNETIFLENV